MHKLDSRHTVGSIRELDPFDFTSRFLPYRLDLPHLHRDHELVLLSSKKQHRRIGLDAWQCLCCVPLLSQQRRYREEWFEMWHDERDKGPDRQQGVFEDDTVYLASEFSNGERFQA